MAATAKIDLYKTHKAEYVTPKQPTLVKVGPAKYLAIAGTGEPGGDLFQKQIGALYTMAFTIKMTRKAAGRDFRVMHLEGTFWTPRGVTTEEAGAQKRWSWKLLVRVPTYVGEHDLKSAVAAIRARGKAGDIPIAKVTLDTMNEGLSVQVLHVGPYETEPETIARMRAFVAEKGLRLHGRHHEIYLSDPRRVKPERYRTIIRHPVR